MSYLVCTLFLLTIVMALTTNRDLFSPAKLFLFSFLVFHVGALFQVGSIELWLLLLMVMLVGLLTAAFEASLPLPAAPVQARSVPGRLRTNARQAEGRLFLWIWLLSAPALLSQVYMVQLFGGFEGYINSLGMRVIEWRGLGWAKTLIATLLPINLVYFAVGLTRRRHWGWWALYSAHFVILLLFGLLSGSRSGVLNVFALQLFCYHYLWRPVRMRSVLSVGAALMAAALVLGVVRDGIKVDAGELVTGLDSADSALKIAIFYYGVEPLELILNAPDLPLAYGSTFVSLLTNAVPRPWWPNKPDTGGVFFTKAYTGDAWEGASNLTPTFLGEWIINFGWVVGLCGFVVAYPALMYWVVRRYRLTLARLLATLSALTAVDFVTYLLIMWSVIALMTGEVTNVLLNLVLTQLIPLAVIRLLATSSSSRFGTHRPAALAASSTR